MERAKAYLLGMALLVALTGTVLTFGPFPSSTTAAPGESGAHWRYHDGHWSYWDSSDKRWYYTDGAHWYYHDKDAWRPYNFDAHHGREHFERGDYRHPGKGAKIELPRHKVYIERR